MKLVHGIPPMSRTPSLFCCAEMGGGAYLSGRLALDAHSRLRTKPWPCRAHQPPRIWKTADGPRGGDTTTPLDLLARPVGKSRTPLRVICRWPHRGKVGARRGHGENLPGLIVVPISLHNPSRRTGRCSLDLHQPVQDELGGRKRVDTGCLPRRNYPRPPDLWVLRHEMDSSAC